MNPILSMLNGGKGGMNILMQAVGAAMRGETPEAFLQNLARTNPQLRGLDLNNLESTARSLADSKGVDMNQLTESVKSTINKLV